MDPRVAETRPARALLWVLLAAAALVGTRTPAAPARLALVRDAGTCRLAEVGAAPLCACSELPDDARAALGLPSALNSASVEDLERVPGIGPMRASAIAAERERGGDFASLEALSQRVPGFGPKTIDRIRPHLFAVGPDPACGARSPS